MVRYSEFYSLIKREYQLGHSIEEVLLHLCNEYDILPQTVETIEEWAQKMDEFKPARREIRYVYYELLNSIKSQCNVFEKAIYFEESYYSWRVFPTCSRYGYAEGFVEVEQEQEERDNTNSFKALSIFDHFHGKESTFPFFDGPIRGRNGESSYFYPIPIDHNRLLLFESTYQDNHPCRLHLIQIDWNQMKCKALSQLDLEFMNGRVLVDSCDAERFVILVSTTNANNDIDDTYLTYMGQIKQNQLSIEQNKNRSKYQTDSRQYTQNRLYGIDEQYDSGDNFILSFKYWELDLLNGGTKNFEFECDFDLIAMKIVVNSSHKWKDNLCYMAINSNLYTFHSQILCLNTETQKCFLLDYKIQDMSQIACRMNIDSNYIMSIQSHKAVYRFPMRKPDQLQNLCWFSIRRQSLLKENQKYYENAHQRLPLNSELRFKELPKSESEVKRVLVPEKIEKIIKSYEPSQNSSNYLLFYLILIYVFFVWLYFTFFHINLNVEIVRFNNNSGSDFKCWDF